MKCLVKDIERAARLNGSHHLATHDGDWRPMQVGDFYNTVKYRFCFPSLTANKQWRYEGCS